MFGEFLYGYLMKGPLVLDVNKRSAAEQQAKRVIKWAGQVASYICQCGNDNMDVPNELLQECPILHIPGEDRYNFALHVLKYAGKLPDIADDVRDFIDFWNGRTSYRDVLRIIYPDQQDKQVIFVGGTSKDGAHPQRSDYGFEMGNTAYILGLFEVFGIHSTRQRFGRA